MQFHSLEFEYVLDARRLGPSECESGESLYFWNSTSISWQSVIIQRVNWDDNSRCLSHGNVKIQLHLKSDNSIAYDESIGIRLVVKSINHEGFLSDCQAGHALIYIKDVIKNLISSNGYYNQTHEIYLKTLKSKYS
jgi:hypothetical protein